LAFVLVLLLLLLHPNDIKDGLTQVHGILQSNADSLKGMFVLVDPMAEQSTKAQLAPLH
jgi:hypothetical protein